ncbi:MAG: putative colanic acid biosynthesis acetyltransferase [Pseudomonadota bacterium]
MTDGQKDMDRRTESQENLTFPDIQSNRRARKYSLKVQVMRVLWALSYPLFRLSPRPLWGARRIILRAFGAKVARGVRIYPDVAVFMPWNIELGEQSTIGWGVRLYALGPMIIGNSATISQYAHLCGGTHDISKPDRPLVKCKIEIGAGAWVATEAFIGPDVTIGERAIVGARAVVMRDVPADAIAQGNPAKVMTRD